MSFHISIDDDAISGLLEPILSECLKRFEVALQASGSATDKLYDVTSLASYLDVSKDWVYGMVRKRGIPYYKVGNNNRFRKNDIDLWLNDYYSKPLSVNPASRALELLRK